MGCRSTGWIVANAVPSILGWVNRDCVRVCCRRTTAKTTVALIHAVVALAVAPAAAAAMVRDAWSRSAVTGHSARLIAATGHRFGNALSTTLGASNRWCLRWGSDAPILLARSHRTPVFVVAHSSSCITVSATFPSRVVVRRWCHTPVGCIGHSEAPALTIHRHRRRLVTRAGRSADALSWFRFRCAYVARVGSVSASAFISLTTRTNTRVQGIPVIGL